MSLLSNSIHVGLFVDNMEVMVTFYRDILGLEAGWDGGPYAEFTIRDGGLFMFDRKEFSRSMQQVYQAPKGYNQTMEIGIGVPSAEDVDAEYRRLTALGVVSLTGEPITQPWGQRNFFFADPEGNYIETGAFL